MPRSSSLRSRRKPSKRSSDQNEAEEEEKESSALPDDHHGDDDDDDDDVISDEGLVVVFSKSNGRGNGNHRQSKMQQEINELGDEYEIAAPARSEGGHLKRRVPKTQWKDRTRKRKLLEKADEKATAAAVANAEEYSSTQQQRRRRLRGSRVAFDEQLIQDSHVLFPTTTTQPVTIANRTVEDASSEEDRKPAARKESSKRRNELNDEPDSEDFEEENDDPDEDDNENEEEGMVDDEADDEDDDDYDGEEEEDIEEGEEDYHNDGFDDVGPKEEEEEEEEENPSKDDDAAAEDESRLPRRKNKRKKVAPKMSSRRRMFRLRNFQSQRMAQRHGEALAAHARGQPGDAIRLLKMVAKSAPSAPQIYSSLGMVYEDMLKQSRRRGETRPSSSEAEMDNHDTSTTSRDQTSEATKVDQSNRKSSIGILEGSIPDPSLAEELNLAQKAYGSYHVAAILCKRDYMLWVRAADAGMEVVRVLEQAILIPSLTPEVVAYNLSEKKRWLSEILRDLHTADKLHPPGIDVPCKLAAMQIEMGNLSEALTILTDLKNGKDSASGPGGRSEFQSSYKAWLLYGDLMLRIGHECIQWNRDIRSNDNYMFRRWLRKFSQVFDWQERRLQALSLALEAAAGTKSTAHFIEWMRDRAYKMGGHGAKKDDSNVSADGAVSGNSNSEPDSTSAQQFESEKQMMLAKHSSEMEAFDRTTSDMDLTSNSVAARDRQVNRDELLKNQEDAFDLLNREYECGEKQSQVENKEDDKVLTDFHDSMPISASCREVCRIASELMKHLHGLELFEGARLVGESVSDYLKERAAKHDTRSAASKRAQEWQEKLSQPSFLFESYEEGSDDEFSNEGDSSPYLSDDEDLDRDDSSQLLESLRKGILPPELRILYGLALIGEGGRNFLAGKCLEAIDDLEQESSSWLFSGERETEASVEPLWYLFHRAMTEPLGRTAAYAFLADVLRKTEKEQEWSVHFSSWFRKHLATLDSVGLKEQLMRLREDISPFVNFRKNQLLKIVVAACSFDIDTAESPSQQSPVNRELIVTNDTERVDIAIAAMKSLSEVLHLMWKVDSDGSIPQICAEVIKVSSRCYRWLAQEAKARLSYTQLHRVLGYAKTLLSFLSGFSANFPDFKTSDEIELLKERQWGTLPIKATWQAPEYRPMSLRTYNLTVACNVSLFSGWEPEEFTFRLLRRRHGHKHFGVHLRERRVTGYLNSAMEKEIGRQWGEVQKLLPSFPDIKFQERLEAVKQSEWYTTEVEDRKDSLEGTDIARYGEESGEELYLAFSALCLHLAASESNTKVINRLLHASLSVLLPVSQFCVDDRLWDSDIGEAASSLSGFDEWKLLKRMDLDDAMNQLNKKTKRIRKGDKVIERKVEEWIRGTKNPTLQSHVGLPTKEMRRIWFQEDSKEASLEETEAAIEAMKKVHTAMEKLRGCYTEAAVEKGSLQISVALLELASLPGCFDPFRCLQQAAMFASQAPKAGNSDMEYRAKLPEKTECTPLQALIILGRADCLHSVYFPNEAAFLCSYVALICRLHREKMDSKETSAAAAADIYANALEWNDKWKVVAICAYNVSVMIRTTVSTVLDKHQQKSFLSMWDRDVVEELERGRSDGWVWKRTLGGCGGILYPEMNNDFAEDNFEVDEAENSLGELDDNESEEGGQGDEEEEDDDDNEDGSDDNGSGDDGSDDNGSAEDNDVINDDCASANGDYDEQRMEAQQEDFMETGGTQVIPVFPYEMPLLSMPIPDFVAAEPSSSRNKNRGKDDDEMPLMVPV